MRSVIQIACVISATGCAADADGISGFYSVSGVEPSGIPYTSSAEISMTGSTTAEIQLDTLGAPVVGVCMVTDSEVACHADKGGGYYSMVIYEREANGVLKGVWIHSGLKGLGQETLTPAN